MKDLLNSMQQGSIKQGSGIIICCGLWDDVNLLES